VILRYSQFLKLTRAAEVSIIDRDLPNAFDWLGWPCFIHQLPTSIQNIPESPPVMLFNNLRPSNLSPSFWPFPGLFFEELPIQNGLLGWLLIALEGIVSAPFSVQWLVPVPTVGAWLVLGSPGEEI